LLANKSTVKHNRQHLSTTIFSVHLRVTIVRLTTIIARSVTVIVRLISMNARLAIIIVCKLIIVRSITVMFTYRSSGTD